MRILLTSVISLLAALLLAEAMVRLLGHAPYADPVPGDKITASPGPMFCPDSVYGYTNCAGQFDVTLNCSLTYHLTIDSADRSRQLPDTLAVQAGSATEVHIHGCSFFAGMGVNDHEVLSAHLQRLLGKDYRVVNRAISGHGMTTQLRQLAAAMEQGQGSVPAVAVFSIASFHLHRNPGAADYLNRFQVIRDRPMRFLCADLDRDGHVHTSIKDVRPRLLPGARHLALMRLLGDVRDRYDTDPEEQLALQLALMDSAHALATGHGVLPLFMLITDDGMSDRIALHARQKGLTLLRSAVDYNDPDYNLMPHDGHPNAQAHARYAQEIAEALARHGLRHAPDTLPPHHAR